jgi:Tfp pilus assembly protein PilF
MSLINRMLRDLSTRAPEGGDAMSGIQIRGPERARKGGALLWIVILGVVAFTAVFWLTMPKKPAAPGTRGGEAITASAPAAGGNAAASRFRLDPTMSPPVGGPAPRRRAERHREPPAALSLDSSLPATHRERATTTTAAPAAPRDARAAQSRLADAGAAMRAGELSTAEKLLRDALEADPSLHEAREKLAMLLLEQGRLDEARSVIDAGLALDPQRNSFRRLGARVDLARGQPAAARTRLEVSPPSVAGDPEYHGLLASAYQRLGLHEEAALEYRALTQAQPGDAHWWAGYGLSRDALGDVPGALAAYAQARSLGNLDQLLLDHINKRTAALQSAG